MRAILGVTMVASNSLGQVFEIMCSQCHTTAIYDSSCMTSEDIILNTGFHLDSEYGWVCPECYRTIYKKKKG